MPIGTPPYRIDRRKTLSVINLRTFHYHHRRSFQSSLADIPVSSQAIPKHKTSHHVNPPKTTNTHSISPKRRLDRRLPNPRNPRTNPHQPLLPRPRNLPNHQPVLLIHHPKLLFPPSKSLSRNRADPNPPLHTHLRRRIRLRDRARDHREETLPAALFRRARSDVAWAA